LNIGPPLRAFRHPLGGFLQDFHPRPSEGPLGTVAPVEAAIIDGTAAAAAVREEVAAGVRELVGAGGPVPGLATVLVGEDPASQVYVRRKREATAAAGMRSFDHTLEASIRQDELDALVLDLNADPSVHGILVQSPLPAGLDEARTFNLIDPGKDVDGFHPANAGRLLLGEPGLRPATAAGILHLLHVQGTPLVGAEAVVVGRSTIVGKPVALLLLAEHATVTIAHSRTRDLGAVTRRADVLVAATGRPGLITGDMVQPGATVIDVGITRTPEGLVGDVDFEAARHVAGAITPVPGGVGPMTIAMLLRNTLQAAQASENA
jgi:methylenetetrahydrofolate dehydrogenase (NADP+)/methenyltetrahydrofolate cyclohydrolase